MISLRLSIFPEYVSLSRFIMLMEESLTNNLLIKFDPINPQPPVTNKIVDGLFSKSILELTFFTIL